MQDVLTSDSELYALYVVLIIKIRDNNKPVSYFNIYTFYLTL